jgi:secreted PhoX family phosphatase
VRKPLPIVDTPEAAHPGGRSALTCRFRCGNACFHEVPNTSANAYVGDVIAGALSRRNAMRAAAVVSVAAAAGGTGVAGARPAAAAPQDAAGQAFKETPASASASGARGLRFRAVAPNNADTVTIPDGYAQNVVVRWGEPILRGAPAFDPDRQTATAQAGQFGYNNDFLALLPVPGERGRQLLVANHEYTDEVLMFRGYDAANPTREQVEVAWAAHGLSAVVVEEDRGSDRRGELKQFLTMPVGAETCGPLVRDRRVLVAVQHPGEIAGATVESPASTWPDGPGKIVRPAVVAVWRKDGRDIGV